ncbi:MAG: DMT family transporter [Patescibacteria group bacterium]
MTSYRLRAYIYLLIVALIWGAASPIIKFTLEGIDPLPFLAYRFAIASVFSIFFFLISGISLPKPKNSIPLIILYGLLAVPIGLGALFAGLDRSTVLDLTLITSIGPMVVIVGGAFFFRDHITHREKIGVTIVLIGVFVNSLYPIFTSGLGARITGNLYLLAFLLADSGAVLVAKLSVKRRIKSLTLTNFAFILGAITIIPITVISYGGQNLINTIISLPFKYHLGVWYMALISGTLAYFLFVRGHKSIEVSEAILFNYLQPVFAIPLAVFWLGEKITTSFIIGATFIVIGLIIVEYKKKKLKPKI